jgi:hypothetical protein
VPLKINDIHELVAAVQLGNILVHEERARRLHWSEDELLNLNFPLAENSMGISENGLERRFRFRSRFTDASGEYVADFEAIYSLPELADVAQPILTEFAERVAFMAIYPFLRASIFASASRLGLPIPVLGIVRQGEFSSGDQMTAEQVKSEFGDNRSEVASASSI